MVTLRSDVQVHLGGLRYENGEFTGPIVFVGTGGATVGQAEAWLEEFAECLRAGLGERGRR